MNRISTGYRNFCIALATAVPVLAFAQADPFAQAISEIETKVTTYGTSLVGLAAVAVVFFVAIKYVKKITKAA